MTLGTCAALPAHPVKIGDSFRDQGRNLGGSSALENHDGFASAVAAAFEREKAMLI